MGKFVGSWKIDDVVFHKIQTSSVTTGAAVDADSVPTWRVYEDGTTTPVTTGSYTTFNSLAGFYNAAITLAASIGYEKGKNYYIRYAATVASIIGADVDTFQIEAEVDSNSVSVTVNANAVALAAGAITAGTITDGAFTSAKFGAGFITAGSLTSGALSAAKFAADAIAALTTVGSTAVAAIADGVWDEAKSGHTTADTYGEYLDATVSGIGGAGAVTVGATAVAAIAVAVWSETAAKYTTSGSMGFQLAEAETLGAIVNAIWDEPKANHTTADTYGEYLDGTITAIAGGSADTTVSPTAIAAIADAVWDEHGADHISAGSFGARLNVTINSMTAGAIGPVTVGSTSQAAIVAAITAGSIGAVTVGATSQSAISTAVTAGSIGAVTVGSTSVSAIQSGLATQASVDTIDDFLDTEIAAIKAKTDSLTFTVAGVVDANVQRINDVAITGDGQVGTEFGV